MVQLISTSNDGANSKTSTGRCRLMSSRMPLVKGEGGLRSDYLRQIPPRPPLLKGGTAPIHRKLNAPVGGGLARKVALFFLYSPQARDDHVGSHDVAEYRVERGERRRVLGVRMRRVTVAHHHRLEVEHH